MQAQSRPETSGIAQIIGNGGLETGQASQTYRIVHAFGAAQQGLGCFPIHNLRFQQLVKQLHLAGRQNRHAHFHFLRLGQALDLAGRHTGLTGIEDRTQSLDDLWLDLLLPTQLLRLVAQFFQGQTHRLIAQMTFQRCQLVQA